MSLRLSTAVVCVIVGLFVATVAGQDQPGMKKAETPKRISGGVLNGKATYLPKPNYPPAARAVGAGGPVTVEVLIDEQGYVATATAVSGHPLLREAAVEAAHSARFKPTTLDGIPVRISGVITYNFVPSVSPMSIGYELGFAERAGFFGQSPDVLAFQLPAGWESEKKVLTTLTYQPGAVKKADGSQQEDASFGARVDLNAENMRRMLTAESLAEVRRLQGNIEGRLRAEEKRLWAFRLGRALGAFVAEIKDAGRYNLNLAELEALAASAPSMASEPDAARLKAFVEKSRDPGLSDDAKKALAVEARELLGMQY